MSATHLQWRLSLSSLSTPPVALPSLRTSNSVSRNTLTVSSLGLSNHRAKQIGITKRAAAISKRGSSQTQKGVWEEPDDGSEEEEEEKDWEYETESVGCGGVAAAAAYAERIRGEVEELLTPEERYILEQNEAPDVSKISTDCFTTLKTVGSSERLNSSQMKWGLLHTLALSGQIPFMDKLLEQGADIDSRDQDGFTPLHKAVIGKKETVISHLLRKGANPNVKDKDGATPLHYAVQVGGFQTVKLLIKYKVDVNAADDIAINNMEEEKDVFYVVRKGDIVGVYNTLTDSPSFHSSSICDPPISIYKGYCLSKETEKYLASHGLTNASYSISFADVKVKEGLFGRPVPCPHQLPPSEDKATQQRFSVNDDIGVTEIEDTHEVGSDRVKSLQIDAFRKHVNLEDSQAVSRLSTILTSKAFLQVYCILYFAGSSSGNPGKAGAGAILRSEDGTLVCQLREGVGISTCDEAEFRALVLGLRAALRKGFTHIFALGNSDIVCGWVQGMCKIKDARMSFLCEEALKLKDKFFSFQIKHVSKTANFTKLVMRINLDVIKFRGYTIVWSLYFLFGCKRHPSF
ncbi:hypothetical protein Sjap_023675 [Stephania japonica]|uniref:RNase H type-1 domain-containing protein n=1 Tax=Stephania japonica TaxID=461633 RepID=A0AAP0EHB0_9MAGN